jgi:hypothetical protein
MKICELFEQKEEKEKLLPVDQIAMLLFRKKAGIVTDPKRDKDKKYIGVAHEKSTIKGLTGKPLTLTFDNSTDSGDFEIDSLTPLKIEKGGDIDKQIKKLYAKHEIGTKKKIGYIVKTDVSYVREIVLGEKLGRPAVKLVQDLLKILKPLSGETDETEEDAKKETKEAPKKETKEAPKDAPKDAPKKETPPPKKEVPKKEPEPKKEEPKKGK